MHTRNFTENEFVCRCGRCQFSVPQTGIVVPALMIALQQARDVLQAPIRVTSGRRCYRHNQYVGGVANSYHLAGYAADVVADDMNALRRALEVVPAFNYIEIHDRYIHVDVGKPRRNRVEDARGRWKKGK